MFELSDRSTSMLFMTLVVGVSLATATLADGLVLALSPLLVTVLMLLVVTRDGYHHAVWRRLGITRSGLRWWPVAVLSTAGVSVVATGVVVASGLGQLRAPAPSALVDLGVLVATGTVLACAEEIGWRGYLQPRLHSWMGAWSTYLIVGLCWVTWHLPYILLTNGYHAAGSHAVVLLFFTASVIVFSVLFGMLRDLSASMWPAVLAHAAHNVAFGWLASSVVVTPHPVAVNEYLAGDTGILVTVGTAAAVVLIAALTGRLPALGRRAVA